MEDIFYTVTLADGTELANLRMNGNNFISLDPVKASVFKYNLSPVVISDGEHSEVHENMALVQISQMSDGYYFILRDLTAQELWQAGTDANMAYLSMMTGVDL